MEQQLIIPMSRFLPAHCFNCDTDNLVCYDVKNKAIPFATRPNTSLQDILDNLNNTTLSYLRCKNCGHQYLIDYSLGYIRGVEPSYVRREFFNDTK